MRGRNRISVRFAVLAGAFVLLLGAMILSGILPFTLPAAAQAANGTILGTVKDASGAVVPDVTVTLQHVATGQTRTVQTGPDGAYRAPALPVGNYTVKFEKSGFNTQQQTGLVLDVAQDLVVNANLQVGTAVQEVEVTGEAPMVNTTSAALGGLVGTQQMAELPLNGRNYVDLVFQQPGVTKQIIASSGGFGSAGTWFSANGAPVRSNNTVLDGALMQNAFAAATSSENGTTLGVDGIAEYKVVTSAVAAEYGMVMGAQTVMVSKSGSNSFHGDAYEYLRNSALDARNYFDTSAGSGGKRLPLFQRNNFGGSFGGPIQKNKTFFYGVYEGLRQNLGVTVFDNVLPAACHQLVANGANYAFAPGVNPASCATGLTAASVIPGQIKPLLDLYPLPTPGLGGPALAPQFTFPTASTQGENYGQMRVDHNFSASDNLFVRYTIDDGHLNNATGSNQAVSSGAAFPQYRTAGLSRNQFATLSENHVFSPTLLNSLRLSFSRTNFGAFNEYVQNLTSPQLSMVAGQPTGGIAFLGGGITGFGPGNYPTVHIQDIWTLADDLMYTRGKHAFKFGALYNSYWLMNLEAKLTQGQVAFSNPANFMQGIYANFSSLTPGSNLQRYWHFNTIGMYAQDDFRVTSRLTLNYGLRYEFMTIPQENDGKMSRFLNFTDPTQSWSYGNVMNNPSLHNFSPRLGFAYDVTGRGTTSVRGGFGWYFDVANMGSAIDQVNLAMPPYSGQSAVNNNRGKCSATWNLNNGPCPSAQKLAGNDIVQIPFQYYPYETGSRLQNMAYNLKNPQSFQYNLTIEQQLPFSTGLTVSYVGLHGLNLWQTREFNPFRPVLINGSYAWQKYLCGGVPSTSPCAGLTDTTSPVNPAYQRLNPNYQTSITTATMGASWFNSLQVSLNRRLVKGLQFQSSYTWSKSLDTTQGQLYSSDCSAAGALQGANPFDPLYDKGPSCFDIAQNWHANLIYHLPNFQSSNFAAKLARGWWFGNIVSVQSGLPFTPMVQANRSNSGVLNGQGQTSVLDRASLVTPADVQFCQSNPASCKYTPVAFDAGSVITGNPKQWFNPNMFKLAAPGFLGDAGRDMLRGPGLLEWDLSVNKDTRLPFLGEAGMVQFRAEFFNILNRTNFALPTQGNASTANVFSGSVNDPAGMTELPNTTVGQISTTATSSRQIQLALKFIF